jgi:hypothetical protein
MRRLARRSFVLAALLSALVFAATCVLWWRSYARYESFTVVRPTWHCGVTSVRGGMSLCLWTFGFPDAQSLQQKRSRQRRSWSHQSMATTTMNHIAYGFYSSSGTSAKGFRQDARFFTFPHWSLAAASAVAPLAYVVHLLRRRARPPGHCAACGYDLRASPDRCPECGALAAAITASQGSLPPARVY